MTKTELQQYRNILNELAYLEGEIKRIRESAIYPSSQIITDMPIAPHSDDDKMATMVAKLDELERLYAKQYEKHLTLKKDIECAIMTLTDMMERRIMRLRYMQGLRWKEINMAVGYSPRQSKRIHDRALKKIVKSEKSKGENKNE